MPKVSVMPLMNAPESNSECSVAVWSMAYFALFVLKYYN